MFERKNPHSRDLLFRDICVCFPSRITLVEFRRVFCYFSNQRISETIDYVFCC